MNLTTARKKLAELQSRMSAYGHALALLSYDGATTAPKGTAANRAATSAVLSEEYYKLSTSKRTIALLEELDAQKSSLTEEEQRQVFLLLRDLRETAKIPMKEYVDFETLLVEADDVWHKAKETSDFGLFAPYLEKIFETRKRFANYVAPEKDPYDYLLGKFEDGIDRPFCDRFFGTVRRKLVPLISAAAEKEQVDGSCLKGRFPVAKQREFSLKLMALMGLDLSRVGLSETEHPFTTSLGSQYDVRITTHYHEEDFSYSMYSVIHEGGHALYDSGSRPAYARTVLDGGVTMGIHESQSRFYENILGRSRAFLTFLYPILTKYFPSLRQYGPEDFYRALNAVCPSLIRTEADEVTYTLHVMVRYELEKRMMAGEMTVGDLPAEWNRLYKKYLGVTVPDDRRGVLQDSHWSGGAIGYFPSYALGSAYGVNFLRKMEKDVPVFEDLAKGDFSRINKWNRSHIWQYGCLYPSDVLLKKVLGKKFDPSLYTDYLASKVKDVYKL